MKHNMGAIDRIIRLIVAVIIAVLFYQGIVIGLAGIVLFIIACILALTAIVGICPIYSLLGISTHAVKKHV